MDVVAIEPEEDKQQMIVEGYAIRFEEPATHVIGDTSYTEIISRSALDNADLKDVPFKYNHSDQLMIMARTRSKTLELFVDDQGLYIRASLANTTTGRDLYELIKRGDIDKMSFAFTVDDDEYNRETKTRRITKIKKLYDVAAVDTPFYDTTTLSARSFFEMEIEKERKAADAAELRKKLLLKTRL